MTASQSELDPSPSNGVPSQSSFVAARARAATQRQAPAHIRAEAVAGADAVDFAGADGFVLAVAVACGITPARSPQGGSWRVSRAQGNTLARHLTERGADLEISAPASTRSEVE